MSRIKNMTDGNIYKNYLTYAFPLILSSVLASLYSTVDAVIAGKFISENALGAISATASFDILLNAFFNGFSSGFSVYIAQLFGRGDHAGVKRNVVNMTVFVAMISAGLVAAVLLLRGGILDYLNIDPQLREDAERYFTIYSVSYLFSYANMILLRSLYALGMTSFSVWTSLLSAGVNIAGNLIAVLVFDWGVAGLAWSSVVSVLPVTGVYLYMTIKAFRELKGERSAYRLSLKVLSESLSYTLPTALQKMAFHATGMLIAPALNGLGAAATTGYSVMNRMYHFCAQSFWNMCSAVDCHTAQAMGEGAPQKARRGLAAGLWMNIAALTPFLAAFMLLAEPIAQIFFPGGFQGAALEYAVRFFELYAVFLYVNMLGHLMHSYMRSIGQVTTVLCITLFGSGVQVVSSLLLVPHLQMDGIYLGLVLSWVADGALSVLLYFALYHGEKKLKKLWKIP
ncbi:MAG: polysaccharide biosynthesis C-terminal domain-containing protein [Clostridia bacterium]|nr:polysaccharide biosynthesis C-terminal domain-containing protein [Clostridia bacterium]